MDFASMSNDDLATALAERREAATALFALTEPTIEQVDEAEALVASIRDIETEQSTRAAAVQDAADRFAAARDAFSTEVEAADEDEEDEEVIEESADAAVEANTEEAEDGEEDADAGTDEGGTEPAEGDAAMTASATSQQRVKVPAARRVGRRTKRPAVAPARQVTITAAADVPGYSTGQSLDDMEMVTKALMNRAKGFAPFSMSAARAVNSQSGGEPVLHKVGVASFGMDFADTLTASAGNDYSAVRNAFKEQAGNDPATLTAAGWCAPSETVYSYIADYVVDGLISIPEVNAPRGGLLITTGPAKDTQGAALDSHGWDFTETQMEDSNTTKSCETISCPDFVDYRLDAVGYCYKIPLLTQKAYPELITDALRLAGVMYAHRVNRKLINALVSMSTPVSANPYGASVTDTLEALTIVAIKERRKWNIGKNAVMEVKLPQFAEEVFRSDLSRRANAPMDSITDAQIASHFTTRRLNVEYVSDWQELSGPNAAWPNSLQAMIYPAGTFIKAVEDVINLSAVYDAASLSKNEYTGVFFEQGILVAPAGYGSNVVTVPICTSGETGAASFFCNSGSL